MMEYFNSIPLLVIVGAALYLAYALGKMSC
jgi:hypothetical protein